MKDEARKRLERLIQDLQEIQESSPLRITCAVITSTVESPVRSQATWQWVAQFVRASRHEDDNIIVDPKPIVVDPFMDGKGCVRWCGQDGKRDKITEWLTRLSGFFQSNPELVPDVEPRYGIEGGLQALCAIADLVPELSTLVKRRTILQLTGKRTLPPKTPPQLQRIKPRPSFDMMEIDVPVPYFSLIVLNHVLGKPTRTSRIEVQIDESPKAQYANVIVDGISHLVDKEFAVIVRELTKAEAPISQPTMVKKFPILEGLGRFRRIFNKQRNQVPFEIKGDTRGFFLPPEWL